MFRLMKYREFGQIWNCKIYTLDSRKRSDPDLRNSDSIVIHSLNSISISRNFVIRNPKRTRVTQFRNLNLNLKMLAVIRDFFNF